MTLIQFQGDVIVASEVVAIEVAGETIWVHVRSIEDALEYEYDSASEAQEAVSRAISALVALQKP